MFQIGLNPYGFSHAVGLQAFGTPRANPDGSGLRGFIRIASDIDARCFEFDGRWLAPLTNDELAGLATITFAVLPAREGQRRMGVGADAPRSDYALPGSGLDEPLARRMAARLLEAAAGR